MPRLFIVALAAALLAGPGVVRADDLGEELPWWAAADYPDEPSEPELAAAPPVDAPEDEGWWAGGDDAVVALGTYDETILAVEQPVLPEPEQAEGDDGGRNPLFHRPEGGRPEGHRAGEDPLGGTADEPEAAESLFDEEAGESEAGTAEEPPNQDVVLEERREGVNQCNRYPKQIARYEAELEMAKDRGNERAEALLEAQIERLKKRDKIKCPRYEGPSNLDKAIVVTAKLIKLAAKVARYMYGSPF